MAFSDSKNVPYEPSTDCQHFTRRTYTFVWLIRFGYWGAISYSIIILIVSYESSSIVDVIPKVMTLELEVKGHWLLRIPIRQPSKLYQIWNWTVVNQRSQWPFTSRFRVMTFGMTSLGWHRRGEAATCSYFSFFFSRPRFFEYNAEKSPTTGFRGAVALPPWLRPCNSRLILNKIIMIALQNRK